MNTQELMKAVHFDDIKPYLIELRPGLSDLQAYEKTYVTLRDIVPTFSYFDMVIRISRKQEKIIVTNTHLGALSDLAGRRIQISAENPISLPEAAAGLVDQITQYGYDTEKYKDHLDDWDSDMMDPQKARNLR